LGKDALQTNTHRDGIYYCQPQEVDVLAIRFRLAPLLVAAQAYGVVLQPGKLSLVTELMRGGDMYHSLRHHPHLMR
jgi:hypothetical protein